MELDRTVYFTCRFDPPQNPTQSHLSRQLVGSVDSGSSTENQQVMIVFKPAIQNQQQRQWSMAIGPFSCFAHARQIEQIWKQESNSFSKNVLELGYWLAVWTRKSFFLVP